MQLSPFRHQACENLWHFQVQNFSPFYWWNYHFLKIIILPLLCMHVSLSLSISLSLSLSLHVCVCVCVWYYIGHVWVFVPYKYHSDLIDKFNKSWSTEKQWFLSLKRLGILPLYPFWTGHSKYWLVLHCLPSEGGVFGDSCCTMTTEVHTLFATTTDFLAIWGQLVPYPPYLKCLTFWHAGITLIITHIFLFESTMSKSLTWKWPV